MTTLIISSGVILSLIGLLVCIRLWLVSAEDLRRKASTGIKVSAALGFVVLPLGAVAVANYHTFEGAKDVDACGSCHAMKVEDMRNPQSRVLAALHYQNSWIGDQQCYSCHSGHGLSGTLQAKGDGFRHLARYVTGAHETPVIHRGYFDNNNCLKCHSTTAKYQAISSHTTIEKRLASSQTSCLNCHGLGHGGHAIPVTYGK